LSAKLNRKKKTAKKNIKGPGQLKLSGNGIVFEKRRVKIKIASMKNLFNSNWSQLLLTTINNPNKIPSIYPNNHGKKRFPQN
jgi:hypothetical protein